MAKEWYLLKSPHNQLSGFESESFDNFATEGFSEILESELASDVELCNYDLSECTPLRVVVQGTVHDTRLKTLSRQILAPIGTLKAGMYIKYKNRYWLIIGLVDDNGFYEKAVATICNHLLTWVNDDGKIIQRWANITSASQYNHGETSTENYFVRSDQLMILTPNDDECVILSSGKRFIIDNRCKIYENKFGLDITKDTNNPVIVYKLTRADSVLYDYQDSGHYEFLAYQDEQKEDDGYYVVNGKGYWLCQPPISNNKTSISSCSIDYESNEIYDGLEAGEFTARFYDSLGNEISIEPQWEIHCDFIDSLNISYVNNTILISVDNPKLVNKSFELFLSGDGYESVKTKVMIKAFL